MVESITVLVGGDLPGSIVPVSLCYPVKERDKNYSYLSKFTLKLLLCIYCVLLCVLCCPAQIGVPVPREHDVIVMKLLPAVVLP